MVSREHKLQIINRLPQILLLALLTAATFSALRKSGQDLNVFYYAWRLAAEGQYFELYRSGPDRFLYAPGFAFLGIPLTYLPFKFLLVIWILAKLSLVVYLYQFGARWIQSYFSISRIRAEWISLFGLLGIIRPLLIDFRYGQVNFFILGATLIWLATDWNKLSKKKLFLSSLFFGLGALAKVITLPLVIWTVEPKWKIRTSVLLGFLCSLLLLILPIGMSLSFDQAIALHQEWLAALVQKGLPLESHNQSIAAFFLRLLSEGPSYAHILGYDRLNWGLGWISNDSIPEYIPLIKGTIFFFGIGLQLFLWGWSQAQKEAPIKLRMLSLFLCLIPLYLVWKPYFIFTLPLFWVGGAIWMKERKHKQLALLITAFFLINLTTFGIFSAKWTAMFEVGCSMMWGGCLLLVWVFGRVVSRTFKKLS